MVYDDESEQIHDVGSDVDDVMMIVLDVGAVSALGQKVVTMLKSSQLAGISFNWSKTKRINIEKLILTVGGRCIFMLCKSSCWDQTNNFKIFTFILVPSLPPLKMIRLF